MAQAVKAPSFRARAAESYVHGLWLMKDPALIAELKLWYFQALRDKDPFKKDPEGRSLYERLTALTLDRPILQYYRRRARGLCLELRALTVFPLDIPSGTHKVALEQQREIVEGYDPYALARELYLRVGVCDLTRDELTRLWPLWQCARDRRMCYQFASSAQKTEAVNLYLDVFERPFKARSDILDAFLSSTTGDFRAASFP